jgi:hypothetical protein
MAHTGISTALGKTSWFIINSDGKFFQWAIGKVIACSNRNILTNIRLQPVAISSSSPLVQDVFEKLHSIGADFLWVFGLYHQQLMANKELEDRKKSLQDQVWSLQASHELLRRHCNLAEQKILSLEAALLDDDSDCSTEFEPEVPTAFEQKIKTLEEQIVHLKAENRGMKEGLENAGDVIIAYAKKIDEFEGRSDADIHKTRHLDKECTEAL